MALPVDLVRRLQVLQQRLRPGDLVDQRHPLVVLEAVGLHLRDRLAAGGVLLGEQDLPRRLQHRLHHRDDVERVGQRLGVEGVERSHREQRQRLVERERLGQLRRQHVATSQLVGLVEPGDHSGADQAPGQAQRPAGQLELAATVLVVVLQQASHHRERVLLAGGDVDQHRVVDLHPRHQLLGHAGDQLVEGLLAPHHGALGWLPQLGLALLLGLLLGTHGGVLGSGLRLRLLVLDHVLRRLYDDVAGGVEACAAGSAGDLEELTGAQDPLPGAVVLGEGGEQHRADRHVDPDPEGVGAADDGQQTGLGELLHQPPVAGQHPCMVDADPPA